GLKPSKLCLAVLARLSPAARGRGLKRLRGCGDVRAGPSPAARGRGLKPPMLLHVIRLVVVARCARAWIETSTAGLLPEYRKSPAARGRGLKRADGDHGRLRRAVARCARAWIETASRVRSEEHTSELQSRENLVCRLL